MHRNLHPGNVLITHPRGEEPEHVKITDFRMDTISGRGRIELARSRAALPYLAPELSDPDAVPTEAADLYAVAALAVLAVSGVAPPSVADKRPRPGLENAAQRGLPPLPPALGVLLHDCLSSDPADRPASAGQLAELLERVPLDGTPVTRRSPSRLPLVVAMVVAIVALGGAIYWLMSEEDPPPSDPAPAPPPIVDTRHADYMTVLKGVAGEHGDEVKEACLQPLILDPEASKVVQEKFSTRTLRVQLDLTLTADATVERITVLHDDLADFQFGDCIASLAKTWVYPTPPFAGSWEWTPIDVK